MTRFDLATLESIPDPLAGATPNPSPQRATSPGPARGALQRRRWLALLFCVGWFAAELSLSGVRGDMARLPGGYVVALIALPFAAGALCLALALASGRTGLGLRALWLTSVALGAPFAYVVAGGLWPMPYPEAPRGNLAFGVLCFHLAIAWTVPPFIAAGIALSRAFVTRAGARGALLGAAAGLCVAALSGLRCPLSDPAHIVLSHGGAVVVSAALGAWLLARVTRI
jgi:hypothetical protein